MEIAQQLQGCSSSGRVRISECLCEQVCFLGPELGPLAGLLVGPQMGSWLLEEAHISSSRTRHTDRCSCTHCSCTASIWLGRGQFRFR